MKDNERLCSCITLSAKLLVGEGTCLPKTRLNFSTKKVDLTFNDICMVSTILTHCSVYHSGTQFKRSTRADMDRKMDIPIDNHEIEYFNYKYRNS